MNEPYLFLVNDYRAYLQHSAKGTHWKNGHAYAYIKNGRYYYPDEIAGGSSNRPRGHERNVTGTGTVSKGEKLGLGGPVGGKKPVSGIGNGIKSSASSGSRAKRIINRTSKAINKIKNTSLSSIGSAKKKATAIKNEARAIRTDYKNERSYLSTRREAATAALGGYLHRRNARKKSRK